MSGSPRTSGVFGTDPLDSRIAPGRARRRERETWSLRNRLALGLSATPAPGLLLAIGLALGPGGLNLLSRSVLSYLDPAVSAALAAVGLLVGLGLEPGRPRERRLLAAASLEAGLTILLVGTGILVASAGSASAVSGWALAAILGVCAAASSTSPAADATAGTATSRVADLDDVLPILLGGLLLVVIRAGSVGGSAWLAVESAALAAGVAFAAWLLLARAPSPSEQHVFTAGIVLLLGGLAEFLGMSALFFGLVAGVCVGALRGDARERIGQDLRHVQHPLLVLLLLIAGARVEFTPGVLVLVLVYVALRLAGKVGGGALLRLLPGALPADVGPSLVSPGIIGAAFALNVGQAGADPSGLVLAVAVTGSIFTEVVALLAAPRERT